MPTSSRKIYMYINCGRMKGISPYIYLSVSLHKKTAEIPQSPCGDNSLFKGVERPHHTFRIFELKRVSFY